MQTENNADNSKPELSRMPADNQPVASSTSGVMSDTSFQGLRLEKINSSVEYNSAGDYIIGIIGTFILDYALLSAINTVFEYSNAVTVGSILVFIDLALAAIAGIFKKKSLARGIIAAVLAPIVVFGLLFGSCIIMYSMSK